MAARRPFWKWHLWKSEGFFPYTQVMCYWSLESILIAKLKLKSGNWKIQYGWQAAILKVTSLKINQLWPMATNTMHMKFEIEILKQTWFTLQKPCKLQGPATKSIQYGCQVAILEVTLRKINRLLPIATNNMHIKFEIEIPKQTSVTLQKPCYLQMDGWTDGPRDGWADGQIMWIQSNPHQLRWAGV